MATGEQTMIEEPNDDEVLLKIASVGICGSDIHYLIHGRIGDFIVKKPMIMGHESSGTVVKVGKTVQNLKVGDRVAIEPGVPCRICEFCKSGRYNLCPDIKFCATPPVNGTLRRFYKHAADFCYKLPNHVSLEEGALLEPLSVGVHVCKRAGIGINSSVLIMGAGPIGLVTLLVAEAMGAKNVIITDIKPYRLKIAENLKAKGTFLIKEDNTINYNIERLHSLFNGKPDVTIDASGVESSIQLAIRVTKTGGCVVLVGMGRSEMRIPIIDALIREVDIKGVFRYVNNYPEALTLVTNNKVNVKPLITHNYNIKDALQAFEIAKGNQDGVIKVMIHCGL
ncbi:sorbitol dehydrogenase-like isoform X2 [Phymastichus coffea]|uniref:sorbitol dehydrogenase-like isoform X2 n=1 Tax=Phymastichus coffea TaxID=108790 RepID=UPI00273AB7A6|nr:sorbitol dehydrogenase-like isoform X2 [Phymastichus coffea]